MLRVAHIAFTAIDLSGDGVVRVAVKTTDAPPLERFPQNRVKLNPTRTTIPSLSFTSCASSTLLRQQQ